SLEPRREAALLLYALAQDAEQKLRGGTSSVPTCLAAVALGAVSMCLSNETCDGRAIARMVAQPSDFVEVPPGCDPAALTARHSSLPEAHDALLHVVQRAHQALQLSSSATPEQAIKATVGALLDLLEVLN